ncbi:unnamed protein product [Callosobruchus maculatus]|uniref:Uncharacterized protein n=1 Tax=Callosobruchus maculatus TaxID=64391 RepID=A0A653BFR2_CALMS|nr:unnamed protein product [Callosobruchus maculatus]
MSEEHRQQQSQFQVQIIVTPVQGCDGRAEIRVIGGTPRSSTPSSPTHRPVEQATVFVDSVCV